jgi:DNA-binding GntR family transcriptional regulator
MALDHDSPDALYVQLAQEHEVSVGTAERALAILRDEGLIKSAIGRGQFVVRR